MILLLLLLLDQHHLLLILLQLLLLVANKVTELHLLLNQVLGLRERANKLVSLLSLHLMNFVLVPHVDPFEVLLFVLQLHLLITQLSSQSLLLFVQVQEDLDVAIKLSFLLILDDLLDVPLFHYLLFLLFADECVLFTHFMSHLCLELTEFLRLLLNMLMHPQLHLVQVLLVDFPGFPKRQALLSL